MAVTITGQVVDPGTAGNLYTSNGAGVAPSFVGQTFYYIGYSVIGWTGTLSSTPVFLSLNTGGNAEFWAYKACTVVMMTVNYNNTGGTSGTMVIQPYGSLNGVTAVGNLGTPISLTASGGAAQSVTQSQSLVMSNGGHIGIRASASATSAYTLGVQMWVQQVGP